MIQNSDASHSAAAGKGALLLLAFWLTLQGFHCCRFAGFEALMKLFCMKLAGLVRAGSPQDPEGPSSQ